MQGSLNQRSKGTWEIKVDVGVNPETGRRRQKTFTIRGTKTQAQAKLRQLLSQIDTGIPLDTSKTRLGEYLESWLKDVVAVRNRPRTGQSYAVIVNRHVIPKLGHIKLSQLQAADVERLEAELLDSGLSGNSVLHVHRVLSKALKDATRKGLIHRNVCTLVEPPKIGPYKVDSPSIEQVAQILDVAKGTPYEPQYRFLAVTGCRRGECLGLRWANVDLEHGVVSIVEAAQYVNGQGIVFTPPKSEASRRGIAIDTQTVAFLRDHQGRQLLHKLSLEGSYEEQDLVFPDLLGRPLNPNTLTKNFQKLADRAGVPGLRLHDLRHAHASGLIRANVHPRVVQDRLGHASAAFTMQVYGHVAAGLQAEAAKSFVELLENPSRKVS